MPGGLLPLRIFEPRYLDMVRDCLRAQTGFGVCLVREGTEVGRAAIPYPYGTQVKIVDWDQGSNGLLQITVEGEQKFRIVDTHVDDAQLLHGKIELLPFEQTASVPLEYQHLVQAMRDILIQIAPGIVYQQPRLDDGLWLGSRFVELLPLSPLLRHELLAMDDAKERLALVADMFTAISKKAKSTKTF